MMEREDWFLTLTGRKVHVLDPQPDDIVLEDVAGALSRICRFGGHLSVHYSVAQHSVLVSQLVPPHLAAPALLHDAAEAYVGDCIGPLKRQLRDWDEIESRWAIAIAIKFGLPPFSLSDELDPAIKQADIEAFLAEHRDLRSGLPMPPSRFHPAPNRVVARPAAIACLDFCDRFFQLFPK